MDTTKLFSLLYTISMLEITPLFIISQILMLISFFITLSAFQMKKSITFRILFVISAIFAGSHFLLLGATTAGVLVFLNGLRWFISIFTKHKAFVVIFIILIGVTSILTWHSWISIFAVTGGLLGTLASFNKNEQDTRKILLGATSSWIIHNSLILTPVGIITESILFISNIIGYWRNWRKK